MRLDRVLSACAIAAAPAPRMAPQMNLFGDLFDDKLKGMKEPERPLLPALIRTDPAVYQLQEKMFSFSGEDFNVKDLSGEVVINIEGANLNIGGMVIDKLGFKDASGTKFCSVERRVIAASTCYDIYSADGKELLCKVEREWLSMTPKYQFYYEGDACGTSCLDRVCGPPCWLLAAHMETACSHHARSNPFGDFYAEGSFSDRTYTFKAGGLGGETIARVRRAPEIFEDLDSYAIEVGPGVDAAAIIAVAVIIDEDHDEEDAKRQREGLEPLDKPQGVWPFG